MHPFQEYSSVSFDKYIQPNNQRYNEGYLPHLTEWVPSTEFPPLHVHTLYNQFPTPTNHQSAFSPFRLVLPILECRIGILWYVFYIWLLSLSLMLVRFIHIIVCVSSFFVIVELYFIVWINDSVHLSFHLLGIFQVLIIMNKAACLHFFILFCFWWFNVF